VVPPQRESFAASLGVNRAMLAVLSVTFGLGLTEEIWRNFLAIYMSLTTKDLNAAVGYVGLVACLINLFEGFAYVVGGTVAHHLGPRRALAIASLPMAAGFVLMLTVQQPWAIVLGALLYTNWEPLSVPATFDVVGSHVPTHRRTVAFAVQSIHKRLPKVIGPLIGTALFAIGFWANLGLAFGLLAVTVIAQWRLADRLQPKAEAAAVPLGTVLKAMPPDLRRLLLAEVFVRWGDWFVRDFASLYVVYRLGVPADHWGFWPAWSSAVALMTYIPMARMVDRASSPKPFVGLTFLLFASFPFLLVLLPKAGLPLTVALLIAFGVNGLREMGEPARKSLIAAGFPPEVRARAIGLYWGLRSFLFFPAPLVAWWLWTSPSIGPDRTFLIGGTLGLIGTAWFTAAVRATKQDPP